MKSMTGYGRAQGLVAGRQVAVEVRCYNHRFKEVRVKLPRGWTALEVPAERAIRAWLGRGRAECLVRAATGAGGVGKPFLDLDLAREYLRVVRELADEVEQACGTRQTPGLDWIANADGVIVLGEGIEDDAGAREQMRVLLERALDEAARMREAEGRELQAEIEQRLTGIEELAGQIRARVPEETRMLEERTAERVQFLAQQVEVAHERLAQELAILAEKMDITEELTRLDSHLTQFRAVMRRTGPVGRELDFLLQEMNREVNTLSSKMHAAPVVSLAVSLKAEIEKVREQVQNVE